MCADIISINEILKQKKEKAHTETRAYWAVKRAIKELSPHSIVPEVYEVVKMLWKVKCDLEKRIPPQERKK